jgi:nitroreductase
MGGFGMIDVIMKRRSIRKYEEKAVGDQLVEELLRVAMAAPSAGNQQPWEFVVIRDKEIMKKIQEFHPYSSMLNNCDVAIAVCGNLEKERFKDYWVQDCSAASQNIHLAAQSMGLGTVWLGIYPVAERVEGMKKLLELPQNVIPLSLIPVGYPAEKKEDIDRFNKECIHENKW